MIRLITGLPGHGKTLSVIGDLETEWKNTNRPVVLVGVNGFDRTKLDGHQGRLFVVSYDAAKRWKSKFPKGALVIIDEAQEWAPQRQRGEAPAYITDLSTHRHDGLDFWLITQDPRLLDAWARRLVNEHVHIKRLWGTSWQVRFTWDKVVDQPRDRREQMTATRKVSRLNPEYFDWYKSSVEHNVKKQVPYKVILGLVFVGSLPLIIYFGGKYVFSVAAGESASDGLSDALSSAVVDVAKSNFEPRSVRSSGEGDKRAPNQFGPVVICREVGVMFGRRLFEVEFPGGRSVQMTALKMSENGVSCSSVWSGWLPDSARDDRRGLDLGIFDDLQNR